MWIWNRNERSRNSIIQTWSYFEQVKTKKGKLDIADVEVQITIPTKMQTTWFELQFTFSTLISYLIINNAIIIFHKIPNETFNLNLKSRHIFEFEKPKFQFERKQKEKYTGTENGKSFATLYIQDVCITAFWREKISLHSNSVINMADNSSFICSNHAIEVLLRYICPIVLFNSVTYLWTNYV